VTYNHNFYGKTLVFNDKLGIKSPYYSSMTWSIENTITILQIN